MIDFLLFIQEQTPPVSYFWSLMAQKQVIITQSMHCMDNVCHLIHMQYSGLP